MKAVNLGSGADMRNLSAARFLRNFNVRGQARADYRTRA